MIDFKDGDLVIFTCRTGACYKGVVKQKVSPETYLVILDNGQRRYIRPEFLSLEPVD
jgi:hypothetical protein